LCTNRVIVITLLILPFILGPLLLPLAATTTTTSTTTTTTTTATATATTTTTTLVKWFVSLKMFTVVFVYLQGFKNIELFLTVHFNHILIVRAYLQENVSHLHYKYQTDNVFRGKTQ
jgi:hypothetical protein